MKDNSEICTVKEGCSSAIMYACTCGDPVSFICKDCIGIHLAEPSSHTFISLDQAKELHRSKLRPQDFNINIHKYSTVKIEIQDYIKQINSSKQQIDMFKNQIIAQIEQRCQSSIDQLNLLLRQADTELKSIKLKMRSFTSVEDELLDIFEAKGLIGILEDYLEKVEIDHTSISNSLAKCIIMTISSSYPSISSEETKQSTYKNDNRCIYTARYSKKELIKYDAATNQIQVFDLTPFISKRFNDTSTCTLPDGNVMIVGGGDPIHGDTYRLNPITGVCTKLKSLNTPRRSIHLSCQGEYIYALGGSHSKKAERMEWNSSGWLELPDMKQPRNLFGSYYKDFKLYLIGGSNTSTIEYYDIRTNTFNLLLNMTVPEGMNVVGMVDGQIYILRQNLTILSTKFHILEERREFHSVSFRSISDVVIQDKEIIFYCRDSSIVYSFNTVSKNIKGLICM